MGGMLYYRVKQMVLERLNDKFEDVELKIPCASDYVAIVRLATFGIATRMNFPMEDIEDIKIAVSEACTNAVQYAYKNETDGAVVTVTFRLSKEKLCIIVKDTGCGFDKNEIEKMPLEERDVREMNESAPCLGLGLTFIRNLMDELDIVSTQGEGTMIHMAKHL